MSFSPTPPERTPEQRAEGLKLALEARQQRAKIKADIASGRRSVGDILDQGHRGATDEEGTHARIAGRIQVGDLVMAPKGIGPKKAAKILAEAGITDDTEHLDELNADQVSALKDVFG